MLVHALDIFWQQHPALLYGLAFLLGSFAKQYTHPIALVPILSLWCPLFYFRHLSKSHLCRLVLSILVFIIAFLYTGSTVIFPKGSIEKENAGIALFSPKKVRLATLYGKMWMYYGSLDFYSHDKNLIAKNIPCRLSLSDKLNRPKGTCSYQFQAHLKASSDKRYTLSPLKESPWKALPKTWSLAEARFKAQSALSKHIKSRIKEEQTANFLIGIFTGDFQDRLLSYEFSRFGLQHIIAISGFHFALLASILSLLFSLIFPKRLATLILIGLLCLYFLFLDPSSSIMRAWISCMIALLGSTIGCKAQGLNSLGIGLLIVLIIDPIASSGIGFQFSFAVTAAIFLLFPACDSFMQLFFKKRTLCKALTMGFYTQHAYILLTYLRQALALDLAVNLISMPITLFYFQKFPLLSLAYNLFFPFLISFSLFLLLAGLFFDIFSPWLGSFIHFMNECYTKRVLEYTYNTPISLDKAFSTAHFPVEALVIQCVILFFAGIFYRHILLKRQREAIDWAFL